MSARHIFAAENAVDVEDADLGAGGRALPDPLDEVVLRHASRSPVAVVAVLTPEEATRKHLPFVRHSGLDPESMNTGGGG